LREIAQFSVIFEAYSIFLFLAENGCRLILADLRAAFLFRLNSEFLSEYIFSDES